MNRKIRTFIDANVLISAFRGTGEIAERSFGVLEDPQRTLVSSDFIRLEVLPKARYNRNHDEVEFYEEFFASIKRIIRSSRALVEEAETEANLAGLSGVDALHVAAAKRAKAEEFITTEKSSKPLFRVLGIKIVSLYPA